MKYVELLEEIDGQTNTVTNCSVNRSGIANAFMKDFTRQCEGMTPVKVNDKYSATETLRVISDKPYARALFGIYKRVALTHLIKGGMTKEVNSLIPIPLDIWKTKLKINYEDWDKTDKLLNVLLGARLATLQHIKSKPDWVDTLDIEALRGEVVVKVGKRAENTSFNLVIGKSERTQDFSDFYAAKPSVTDAKVAWYMILQTWVCHPSKRNPNHQILDPWDWDKVPEPHKFKAQELFNELEVKEEEANVEKDLTSPFTI